jgi:hypothetical protein
MAKHATVESEEQHKRFVRNRTADIAAQDRNALKSELDNYAYYFTAKERKAIVKVIQALEELMKIEG